MKEKFVKFIFVAGLITLGHAQAATTPSAANDNATLLMAPDQPGSWIFGLEGMFVKTQPLLYLQTADIPFGNLVYPETISPFNNTPLTKRNIDSTTQFAYGADIGYLFPSAKDIHLSFQHLDLNNKDSFIHPDSNFVILPMDTGLAWPGADADLAQQVNSIDLTFGQHLAIAPRVDIHPFFGLRFADINDNEDNNYYNNYHLDPINVTPYKVWANFTRNNFIGLGPRGGFDSSVKLYKGLSITGTIAASLLVGEQDKSKHFISYVDSDLMSSPKISDSDIIILPEADARLGLAYHYQTPGGNSIDLEAGYLATSYRDVASMVPGNTSNAITQGLLNEENNLTYYGPYVRLQVALLH